MNKKKILLLSDDLRMSSGVGTMSREIVMGTLEHFQWVQIGGAIKHGLRVINHRSSTHNLSSQTKQEKSCRGT